MSLYDSEKWTHEICLFFLVYMSETNKIQGWELHLSKLKNRVVGSSDE
jgi:hypothetical protein